MQFYSGSEEIETTVEKVREEEKGLGEREKWVSKGARKEGVEGRLPKCFAH